MNKSLVKKASLLAALTFLVVPAARADKLAGSISADKLAKNAKKYYGQMVTVQAEVEDVLDEHTFTLDQDTILPGPDVFVLVPRGLTTGLAKDAKVTVTGTVRPFVVADLQRDFDFFKNGKLVTTNKYVEYKTRPVLVADSVMTADGRDLAAEPGLARVGTVAAAAADAANAILTAAQLASGWNGYVGRSVVVRAPVGDLYGTHLLALTEAGRPASLVIVPSGLSATFNGSDMVTVTGTVRPYAVADLSRDFDFFPTDSAMLATRGVDFANHPVLVATSIRLADGTELLLR